MVMNNYSKSTMLWKYVYVIPLAILMLIVVSCSNNSKTKNEADTNKTENNKPEEKSAETQDTEVYVITEHMPQYAGGEEALKTYLKNTISYPKSELEAGVQGKVFVEFVVETDGSISDVQVIEGVSKALNEEAITVVKKMPKWIPGKQGEELKRVKFTLPIMFKIPPKEEVKTK